MDPVPVYMASNVPAYMTATLNLKGKPVVDEDELRWLTLSSDESPAGSAKIRHGSCSTLDASPRATYTRIRFRGSGSLESVHFIDTDAPADLHLSLPGKNPRESVYFVDTDSPADFLLNFSRSSSLECLNDADAEIPLWCLPRTSRLRTEDFKMEETEPLLSDHLSNPASGASDAGGNQVELGGKLAPWLRAETMEDFKPTWSQQLPSPASEGIPVSRRQAELGIRVSSPCLGPHASQNLVADVLQMPSSPEAASVNTAGGLPPAVSRNSDVLHMPWWAEHKGPQTAADTNRPAQEFEIRQNSERGTSESKVMSMVAHMERNAKQSPKRVEIVMPKQPQDAPLRDVTSPSPTIGKTEHRNLPVARCSLVSSQQSPQRSLSEGSAMSGLQRRQNTTGCSPRHSIDKQKPDGATSLETMLWRQLGTENHNTKPMPRFLQSSGAQSCSPRKFSFEPKQLTSDTFSGNHASLVHPRTPSSSPPRVSIRAEQPSTQITDNVPFVEHGSQIVRTPSSSPTRKDFAERTYSNPENVVETTFLQRISQSTRSPMLSPSKYSAEQQHAKPEKVGDTNIMARCLNVRRTPSSSPRASPGRLPMERTRASLGNATDVQRVPPKFAQFSRASSASPQRSFVEHGTISSASSTRFASRESKVKNIVQQFERRFEDRAFETCRSKLGRAVSPQSSSPQARWKMEQ